MDPKWAPAFVVALLAIIGWAVNYGTLTKSIDNAAEKASAVGQALEKHKDDIWPRVGAIEADVAVLNDRCDVKNPKVGKYTRYV